MNIYHNPWFPRIFYKKNDGGKQSGVRGYFLIEWKKVFSIGILVFDKGSREASHSHAFNAITWWIKGSVIEILHPEGTIYPFSRSWKPKFTYRNRFHKVFAERKTYAITFRGPWEDTWQEHRPGVGEVTLTHGREIVDIEQSDDTIQSCKIDYFE